MIKFPFAQIFVFYFMFIQKDLKMTLTTDIFKHSREKPGL